MAFTYTSPTNSDADWVRAVIGDTQSSAGPRPYATTASNFSDAEIAAWITLEGSRGKAAARLFEILAAEWTQEAGKVSLADYKEDFTDRAKGYMAQALVYRKEYGGTQASLSQPTMTRVDGFSNDIDAEDV